MAGHRPRLLTQTPRASPRSLQTPRVLGQTHQLLMAQTEAITSLQQQLAAAGRPRPHPSVPRSSAPEKCDMEMTTAAFRTWRRSMECWLGLNGWPPQEAVLHIRLHCTPALQCSLDARFSDREWRVLATEEALDAIGRIALQVTNQAADWCKFFTSNQEYSESISEYFTRSAQCAADCEFKCPHCNNSLSEYMLLRKLVSGIASVELKEEVFRRCDSFSEVDSLRKFCVAFEAAHKDATRPGVSTKNIGREAMASVATVSSLPDALQEEVGLPPQAAGARQPPPYKPRCGNCGLKHKPGKGSCPAEMLACHNCGKTGHLRKMCRSKGKQVAATEEMEASGIIIAATRNVERQPFIWVKVSIGNNERKSAKIQVVPDTGSQVCVAGPGLLAALNIIKTSLVNRGNLKDVANVSLKPIVVAPTTADVGNATSESADYLLARPDTVPLTPLEENVPQLEAWLLRHFSGSTFNTDRSPLPVMEGKPHSIHLLPDAKPYACHTPASVPRHWEAEVKKQLDEDIRKGILEPVPVGEVTEWCARMVVVAKKSGQPRRTVDYQKLNAACKRETPHTRTPFDLVSGIPRHTYKTTSDAHWGFHQVELQEDSKRLTTFITPWGRNRYRRTPMGHCAAPDAYTRSPQKKGWQPSGTLTCLPNPH
ncbi:hypothetical protein Pcinc_008290 [Petrolisthes cinctipes]|uniref:CCHC-type domain-containing protein n=1 Tax=Petrolisthes cinctipes TaxID=88211 RepID=A0AAE1G986_PETCI|nr:hypothetical protein Pcinc_008290 [Petrolisthes cinctipes]